MSNKEDRAWRDYSRQFRREVLPKLLDSAVFLSIGTDVGNLDVRQAAELGAGTVLRQANPAGSAEGSKDW